MSENLRLLQEWANTPAGAAWYTQGFSRTFVRLTDTGEHATLLARDGAVEVLAGFQPGERRPRRLRHWLGFDPGRWYAEQFILPLDGRAIRQMLAACAGERVTAETQHRLIASVLFPMIEALYAMPVMRSRLLLKLFGLDTFWQEALLDPEGRETLPMTALFKNGQWLVLAGYHGRPRYRYRVKPGHILEEQRRILKAEQADTLAGWLALARWYSRYRASVAARPCPDAVSQKEALA